MQRRARHEHVEEERGLGRCGRDERQEARAVARHDGGRQLVHEELAAPRPASLPSGRMRPASSASSDSTRPPKSRATGSMDRRSRQAVDDEVGHAPRRSGTWRSPSGGVSFRARPAGAARQASSARLGHVVQRRRPVLAATSATSSNSGLARPAGDLHPDGRCRRRSTSPESRGPRASAPRSVARTPRVPVDPLDLARGARRRGAASARTWSTWPGRPFFMVTGLTQASRAPASSAAATA